MISAGVEVILAWRRDIIKFVVDNFHVEPDPWQREALIAFARRDITRFRLALRACAGPGKSAVLAWCGWWFLMCIGGKGEHPKGAVVSITADNLRDNLWAEFNKWQQRSAVLTRKFTWTNTRIFSNDHPETWFLSARSWPKTASEEEQGRTLSGIHSEYVLFLIDESGDIPLPVLKSAEQALSNCKWGRILQSGNPTSMTGMLYAATSILADKWHCVSITGDPDDPNRSPRIDLEWAREQIATYGRSDPWVMAFILGQFPPQAINALISVEEIEAAMRRSPPDVSYAEKRIGVDCARFGDDRTVIGRRQGLATWPPKDMRMADGPQIAAAVAEVYNSWNGADEIFLDNTGGYGSSPYDSLRLAQFSPIPVDFSSSAIKPMYFNKRSEIICEFVDWIKRGGCLYNSPQLRKELLAHTYYFQGGKKRVSEKDQVKKLIKCSPDEVDAYALTFSLPDKPRQAMQQQQSPGKIWLPRSMRKGK